MIKGFFNPRTEGDTFKGLGLAMGMDGTVADAIHRDLYGFLKAAGRDYHIKKVPAFDWSPVGAMDAESGEMVPGAIEVENQYHLRRSHDHRIVSPGTVTDSYAPLSLMDVAEEIAPWVQAGWATPDAVFEARNGSLEVLVLRLDAGMDANELRDGDFYVHYIVIQNPHGRGGKARGKIISFRIVCANTFAAAVSAASDFTITHRVAKGDPEEQAAIMQERTKEAVAAWEKVQAHIADLAKRINVWADATITFADAEHLTDQLLGLADGGTKTLAGKDASGQAKNDREAVLAAYAMPQYGTNGATVYDWINGVTFVNSSPNSDRVKGSKVSMIDRVVRNVDPNGTGLKVEVKAQKVVDAFLGAK